MNKTLKKVLSIILISLILFPIVNEIMSLNDITIEIYKGKSLVQRYVGEEGDFSIIEDLEEKVCYIKDNRKNLKVDTDITKLNTDEYTIRIRRYSTLEII